MICSPTTRRRHDRDVEATNNSDRRLQTLQSDPGGDAKGPFLISSVIVGNDAAGKFPDTIEEQCVLIFRHVRAMLATAGGTPEDVVKMEFWVPDRNAGRVIINQEWTKMFPNLDSLPSRHTHLGNEPRMQATFMAYIDRGPH